MQKKETKRTSVDAKMKRVEELLEGYKPIEHHKPNLYFVRYETLQAFIEMRHEAEGESEQKKRKFALFPYVNILSEKPIVKHKLTEKRPYSLLVDPEKIIDKLEGKFTVWRNLLLKSARDSIETYENISKSEADRIMRETQQEIDRGEKVKELLQACYDSEEKEFKGLDVRASDFLRSEEKGYINMTDGENASTQEYLRTEVPNVVCEIVPEKKIHKKHYIIEQFHKEAVFGFSNIYIKHLGDA